MAIVGPWAIAVYKGKVDWGVVPVPTKDGMPLPATIYTFTDAKNIGHLLRLQEPAAPRGTSLKFATSKDQDGKLLETTGQMPIRTDLATTYADVLREAPRVQDVRRPGVADRRGAERAELRRDLAEDSATPYS